MRERLAKPDPLQHQVSPPIHSILRRKCSCGTAGGASGDCDECKKKETVQRSSTQPSAGAAAPPIVHDVLRSPGRPLDTATRAYMEPRFGHDFGQVRIHADSRAAESARAIDAFAYTVSNNIVFGDGQYAPRSPEGRKLLGHELAHVVQQQGAGPATSSGLHIGPSNDPLEQEADRRADSLDSQAAVMPSAFSSGPGRLQRAPRDPSGPPADAGVPGGAPGGSSPGAAPSGAAPSGSAPPAATPPVAAAPAAICGPDVTAPLIGVMAAMDSDWSGWSANDKEEACWSLQNPSCGPVAWDIVELHNRQWIQDYRPDCGMPPSHDPPCGNTVKVGSDCHFAGSVNYVVFGRMCKLCDFWQRTMHLMIGAHKIHWSGMDADYRPAAAWADAGFNGWSGASSPAGDRNACQPTCTRPFAATANLPNPRFDYHWTPPHSTETVGADCEAMITQHRSIRDNPPDIGDWGP